jgi:hypothetical protein
MDTFRVTAYDQNTQTATVTIVLAAREGFAGQTITGMKIQNIPLDSVASVKAFFRSHADAYIKGKIDEDAKKVAVSPEVAALLGAVTNF